MTAPPLFRIFDFGEHQPRFDGIENALVQHAGDDRRRTADVQIEMAHAGFEFVRHPAHRRAAARGKSFDFDAIAFFELLLDLFFQFGAGRKRYRYLALFLRGIDQLIPFRRAGGFAGLAVGRGREYQHPNQADRQENSRDYDLDWQPFVSITPGKNYVFSEPFSEQFLAGLYNALKENISYVKYYSTNKSNTLGHECLGLDF